MIGALFTDRVTAITAQAWLDRRFGYPKRGIPHYAEVLENPTTHAQWAIPLDARAPLDELRAAFPTMGGPDELGAEWFPPPPPKG